MSPVIRYLQSLNTGKIVLWCYLIWYLVTVFYRFDPAPALWLNSLGISAVVGMALLLSVTGPLKQPLDPWQTFRLFLIPFCVSSFSSLIKGHGYLLVFPAAWDELLFSCGACGVFLSIVFMLKYLAKFNYKKEA
ncbi:MAG: hypothetical protein R3F53_11130 [Gammaproteobacteria bacterium]